MQRAVSNHMTVYKVPEISPYQRLFRALTCLAVFIMLGISYLSIYDPPSFADSTRRDIAIVGFLVVALAIVGAMIFATLESTWKRTSSSTYEISNDKIIESRDGTFPVEISLQEIKSVSQHRSWLVITGGDPLRRIMVPSYTIGFEELKCELTSRSQKPIIEGSPSLRLLPLGLITLAILFLFISHNAAVITIAGLVLLLFQSWGVYTVIRLRRSKPIPRLTLLMYVVSVLIVLWILYKRTI
jgi:hypothetical protein